MHDYIILSGTPQNLHSILIAARQYMRTTKTNPTDAISRAVRLGLESEMNRPLRFQYKFDNARNGTSSRLPIDGETREYIQKIMQLCVVSERHALLTALSRSCLNQDGNILIQTILHHQKGNDSLPLPPALDGKNTEYVLTTPPVAAE